MIRWILVLLVMLLLIDALGPWLRHLGVGRLPGDFHFRLFRRNWHLPLASSVLLSLVCALAVRFL